MSLPKFTSHMISQQPDQTAYLLNKLAEGRGGGDGTLYDTTGQNTDGAMTQKATTNALGTKADAITVGNQLAGKVDKEAGKGLSSNDFTNEELEKLNGIEAGAEVNVQADWDQSDNTADDYIKNKPTIPTATSDLQNDSGFITSVQTANIADGAVTAPKIDWTTAGATQISTGEDLQDVKFLKPGKYVARTSAIAGSLSNCPTPTAFDMWVVNTLADRTDFSDMTLWHYLSRIIMNWTGGAFIQAVYNDATNTWTYGRWIRLSSDQTYMYGSDVGTINTTYVDAYGDSHTIHRVGDLVVLNINLQMKAGTVPANTALITGLPRCGGNSWIAANMVGEDGTGVRLHMQNGTTSLLADRAFTTPAQWYNGQITYLSY